MSQIWLSRWDKDVCYSWRSWTEQSTWIELIVLWYQCFSLFIDILVFTWFVPSLVFGGIYHFEKESARYKKGENQACLCQSLFQPQSQMKNAAWRHLRWTWWIWSDKTNYNTSKFRWKHWISYSERSWHFLQDSPPKKKRWLIFR